MGLPKKATREFHLKLTGWNQSLEHRLEWRVKKVVSSDMECRARMRALLKEDLCQIVEGFVENFKLELCN